MLILLACTGSESGDSPADTEPTDTVTDTAGCAALPATEPAECAAATTGEYLSSCLWDHWDPEDLFLSGQFTEFGPTGVSFLADDGSSYDLSGGTSGVWDELPDLVAAGPVDLLLTGNCGAYGEGTAGMRVTAPDGGLLLLSGRGPGTWTLGDWSAARVDAGCGEREAPTTSCSACQAPQPVAVEGPESLEAWPGTPVESASYRLSVGLSYRGSHYVCADGPGDNLAFWYLVPR